jgi:hypothetical protein
LVKTVKLAILLSLVGCYDDPPAPQPYLVGMTHITQGEVPQTADWLTPGFRLSGDIARQCALRRDNLEEAPHFGFDPAVLEPEDQDLLLQVSTCLTVGPLANRKIRLTGGSEVRGDSAVGYLIEHGIPPQRLERAVVSEAGAYQRVEVVLE